MRKNVPACEATTITELVIVEAIRVSTRGRSNETIVIRLVRGRKGREFEAGEPRIVEKSVDRKIPAINLETSQSSTLILKGGVVNTKSRTQ